MKETGLLLLLLILLLTSLDFFVVWSPIIIYHWESTCVFHSDSDSDSPRTWDRGMVWWLVRSLTIIMTRVTRSLQVSHFSSTTKVQGPIFVSWTWRDIYVVTVILYRLRCLTWWVAVGSASQLSVRTYYLCDSSPIYLFFLSHFFSDTKK